MMWFGANYRSYYDLNGTFYEILAALAQAFTPFFSVLCIGALCAVHGMRCAKASPPASGQPHACQSAASVLCSRVTDYG